MLVAGVGAPKRSCLLRACGMCLWFTSSSCDTIIQHGILFETGKHSWDSGILENPTKQILCAHSGWLCSALTNQPEGLL